MIHNITKEVKDYLNEYRFEKFYDYALFRKVLVRMEHTGLIKSIGKLLP